jgi:hypothetical protein
MVTRGEASNKEVIAMLIQKGKEVPAILHACYADLIIAIVVPLLIFIDLFMWLIAFIPLFFLDEKASIEGLLRAVIKTIKCIFYNLPFLVVVYGVIFAATIVFGYLLNNPLLPKLSDLHALLMAVVLGITSFVPVFAAINGQLYKRLKG